jgi:hypothetical protein
MAVRVIARSRDRAPLQVATMPVLVLGLSLVAPAIDLLSTIQADLPLHEIGLVASAVGGAASLVMWVRFPRTGWLFAACLAAVASLAMRAFGAEIAPMLSLLAVLALGIGGGFSSVEVSLEVV